MTTGGQSRWAAVATLAAGILLAAAFVAITGIAAVQAVAPVTAVAQEAQPGDANSDTISERLRQRGIDVSPEQIDRARRVMEDIRDGVPPDPNQLQQVFGDIRKQVEKQRDKRLQEELGATDDEWKIMAPKIEKVRNLRRLLGDEVGGGMLGGGGGMMFGGGGMFGGPGGTGGRTPVARSTDPNAVPSDIEIRSRKLQTTVDDTQAKPEALTESLKAFRDARAKGKLDLAKAQQELKDVLTVRQEAQLVTLGVLD